MKRNWTRTFFREPIFTPGSQEAQSAAPGEVRAIWRSLRLKPGCRILDVACGTGRHCLALARRGARVVGIDLTKAYLRDAIAAARSIPNCRYIRMDMRALSFEREFDVALSLWTSFGYFASAADDMRVLRGIAHALKPGGLFLIDVIDADWVKEHGEERRWDRRADGSYVLQETRWLGGVDLRLETTWTILTPGKPARSARSVVRAYDRKRLVALLKCAGLNPTTRRFDTRELSREGRLIIVAQNTRD